MPLKRRTKRRILLLLAACGMIILALMLGNLTEGTPESFVRRCMPEWDAAFAALTDLAEKTVSRDQEMPKAVSGIFRIDRKLDSIRMTDEETVNFEFEFGAWDHSPEGEKYIFYQKSDDWWKNSDVKFALFLQEEYDAPIKTEETEGCLSVTGNGIAGRGYIRITRINPCWFVAETYWPT